MKKLFNCFIKEHETIKIKELKQILANTNDEIEIQFYYLSDEKGFIMEELLNV